MEWLIVGMALFLALSNGANDNFKGFATVWGSDTLSYRRALTLATIATVAGSLASLLLSESLLQNFSGKGLVPDAVVNSPLFIVSVAGGAAVTVFLATRLALPISTTHALIGGLVGAGLAQAGGIVHFDKLGGAFLLPLLVSPLLSALFGFAAYHAVRSRRNGIDCACVVAPSPALVGTGAVLKADALPQIMVDSDEACARVAVTAKVSITRTLDRLHILSAMSICFARGVNDTPKLAALLLASHLVDARLSNMSIAAAMALGGLLFARRVAETMSKRVTRLDHAQGLTANLITATLVLAASKWGLPVSTTHVSVGAIAGVGASARTLDWHALRNIALSWLATLPLSGGAAWLIGIAAANLGR